MDEHPLIRFAEGPAGRRAREVIVEVNAQPGDLTCAPSYPGSAPLNAREVKARV